MSTKFSKPAQAAVALEILTGNSSLEQVASAHGIAVETVSSWVESFISGNLITRPQARDQRCMQRSDKETHRAA